MVESEAVLLALLRELDDPEWLEWPQHYDRGETAARFGGLLTRLEGDFAARCTDEQDTQDSSEYGASSWALTRPYAEPGSSSA
ncbi:hypothetical protein [Streptomyces sp. NPDC056453]|uniref:hypothetical protein n=1 Tax=Streptomyces sp. NPDC056453 TaxID=3345822 RepID=UPI00369CAAC3